MSYATTLLRMVTGGTMAAHGLQKLVPAPEAHTAAGKSFESMGFQPGKEIAMATGIAELTGGSLMVLGLGTPMACSLITGVMTGAIAKVHYPNGFWNSDRGFEYNLNILAATFAVAAGGGGALALDGLRGKKHRGVGWAVLQLAAGAAGAWAALSVVEGQALRRFGMLGGAQGQKDDSAGQRFGATGQRQVDLRGEHEDAEPERAPA